MTLKAKVDDINSIDESLRGLYVENNGQYVLEVDGLVDKSKLNEFRDNNVGLMKQISDLEAKVGSVDMDEYNDLKSKAKKLRDKKMIDAGKVDELVTERVTAMRAEYDTQVTELTTKNDVANRQLETLLIDNELRSASAKAGVTSEAVDDVLLRGRAAFKLVEGQAMPHDSTGSVVYGKDGTTPMSVNDWVKNLSQSASHLFTSSQGSGSTGSVKSGGRMNSANMTATQKIAAGLGT
jgi:hypothetical protein